MSVPTLFLPIPFSTHQASYLPSKPVAKCPRSTKPAVQVEKSVRFNLQDLSLELEESEESDGEGVSTPLRSPPPATPTPSPTYSTSTLESSNGPITPPNQPLVISSYPKGIPYAGSLESQYTEIPKLAPVLSSAFRLQWDMKENPADIVELIPDDGNDRAGTIPTGEPMRRIVVVHDALEDWKLTIVNSDNSALTVYQVLLSIHQHLKTWVKKAHFLALKSEVREEITRHYNARVGASAKDPGLQRIDYLPGRVFVGLSARCGSDGQWEFELITDI
ncbi:hypothetical protein CVT25_005341 [Psilocybe cyanescens]|uniref:DUF6699 domain-containing protein n=1 Tax=Psilocybe cyanescens TaxID=93625 RepID=A0A409WWT9_PSICY|nr:hypothetical protein CVT25_005341 [Psilocybe cyanescens]